MPTPIFTARHVLALDDSLNRYVLQGRIVERNILSDSGFSCGFVLLGRGVRQAPLKARPHLFS